MLENKFSVLISVYNKEKPEYLDLSLQSITDKQILRPNQIVLVEDGILTQELYQVINKYKKKYSKLFKIIKLEKNYGLGKALNIGLKNCDFNLVARMDSDDISKPERFKCQIEYFSKYPELDMIGSWIDEFTIIQGKIQVENIRKVPENSLEIKEGLKKMCVFNHPTIMYKKNKVLESGNYIQEFKLEDYYLWIRMALNNCNFYNIQKSLVYFRVTSGTAKRRGGLNLLISDIKFQKKLYKIKYINIYEMFRNMIIYSIYRLLPSKIREIVQKKVLRYNIRKG